LQQLGCRKLAIVLWIIDRCNRLGSRHLGCDAV
jgi:hypothetical protein